MSYESWIDYPIPSCPESGVFIDVGANEGQYTLPRLHLYRWVIAIEPQEEIAKQLEAKVPLLYRDRLIFFPKVALGSTSEVKPIRLLANKTCATFVQDSAAIHDQPHAPGIQQVGEQHVRLIRLDDLRPLFATYPLVVIKIDVEGWELEVLKGATETLRKQKPTVLMEVHSAQLEQQVQSFMAHEQYRLEKRYEQPHWRSWLVFLPNTAKS